MFAGILISDDKLNSKSNMLDYWFQYHDSNYNKLNGVWTAEYKLFSIVISKCIASINDI